VKKLIPSASELREKMDVSRIRRDERQKSFEAIARAAIAHITENLGAILESAIENARRERSPITNATIYSFGFAEKGTKNDSNGNQVYFANPDIDGSAAAGGDDPADGKIPGLYLLDMVNPSREWHTKFTQMLDRHINDMAGGGNDYWTGHRWNRGKPGSGGFYEMTVHWGPKPLATPMGPPSAGRGRGAAGGRGMGPGSATHGHGRGRGPYPGSLVKRLPEAIDANKEKEKEKKIDHPISATLDKKSERMEMEVEKIEKVENAPGISTAPAVATFPLLLSGTSPRCLDDPKIAQTPRTVGPNKSQGVRKSLPKKAVAAAAAEEEK
jgi:hypothetical protein